MTILNVSGVFIGNCLDSNTKCLFAEFEILIVGLGATFNSFIRSESSHNLSNYEVLK